MAKTRPDFEFGKLLVSAPGSDDGYKVHNYWLAKKAFHASGRQVFYQFLQQQLEPFMLEIAISAKEEEEGVQRSFNEKAIKYYYRKDLSSCTTSYCHYYYYPMAPANA